MFQPTALVALLALLAPHNDVQPTNFGVTETSVTLGQSCALQGAAAGLGKGMSTGLKVYFDAVNAAGGVDGRAIDLRTVNDGYEPEKCELATRALIEKTGVFALIGGVGTPTSKVAVPLCEQSKVPFLAPFTGAEFLRNPFNPWVVNLRASYYQEMEALAAYLCDRQGLTKIACFYQDDSYGQAGLTGIQLALERRGHTLAATGKYERNTVAVAQGLKEVAASAPQAVVMVGAYKACAAFITAAKKTPELASTVYCNISFVGTDNLGQELGEAADGVIVSQVVPFPWDERVPVVKDYLAAMKSAKADAEIGFISLEGYLAGKFFCGVLDRVEGSPTRDSFLQAITTGGAFDLGGFELRFGPEDHQGSDRVWLTRFEGKAIRPLE